MESVARKGGAFSCSAQVPMAPRLATVRIAHYGSADCVQLMNKTRMNADDAIGTWAEHTGDELSLFLG